MIKKVLVINNCEVDYIKCEEKIEFFCSRCEKRKVAKKYGQYSKDGTVKRLCNGCYRNLLSKPHGDY